MTAQTNLFDPTRKGYHNSLGLEGTELKKRELKANTQDAIVLNFFTVHPPYKFSASQVTKMLHAQGHNILKDSVKRAISNLTNSKNGKIPFLRRTKELIKGEHNAPEHLYELIK